MEQKQQNIKKESKNEIEELHKKCEEYLNGWKRERADFLNFKKEETERISSLVKFANENIIYNLLPVLDNFNLAAQHLQDQGFLQIKKQLEDLLQKEGIEPIEVIGKEFDPNFMEAVEGEGETVSEEVQKGYMFNGKLIRPAKVKLSK